MKFLPLALGLLAAAPGLASAAVVNIDFNLRESNDPDPAPYTYSGRAAAPDALSNTLWNSVRRTGSSSGFSSASSLNNPPLKDSTGANTGISVIVPSESNGGYAASASLGQGRSVGDQEVGPAGAWQNLMGDFLQLEGPAPAIPGDPIAVVSAYGYIAGLTVGSSYDIYFYAQGDNRDQNSSFAIRDSFGATSSVVGSAEQTGWSSGSATDGQWTEGMEYVKLTGVADDDGRINFSWSNVVDAGDNGGINSRFAVLNAMQIVSVVPEPSTALLGMLGVAGLFVRRRR
jgi:MYXO-CTERM domain-containing protein